MLRKTILLIAAALSFSSAANASEAQIKCMADNIYHEARGESRSGKIAVANVVMNRAQSGKFPGTPCAVIYQRNRGTCQFSWVCTKTKVSFSSNYSEALDIARKVYTGKIGDITGGALFFHSSYVAPSWSKTKRRTLRIGSHLFYR